jgi:hypothetical protein
VQAIAVATGYTTSTAGSAAYTISPPAATPTFNVPAGPYSSAQTVTISSTTPSATIYYTTDGSTPTTSSTAYTGPITVSTTETVNAIAIATGYSASAVGSAAYTITATLNMLVSDDATEDWATIGVKVLSIALVPQSGGNNVTIYTAPATPPVINLVQLDQLGEILGNATVPTGTYTKAVLTLGANNNQTTCDVSLVVSADPEAGFDGTAGASIPCSQIAINGATGTSPNMTVPLIITLKTPLTVTATASNALDLEFNLNDPALIVEHDAAGASAPIWAVNFNGPVRHHLRPDLTRLFLRNLYGQVTAVPTDDTSMTIEKAYPAHPITSPETATLDTNATLPIQLDTTNGTLFFDLDNSSTPTTITTFTSQEATELPTMFVRVVARYQQNGTLVAARIYASSTFDTIWKNPEGHVLHVNTTSNVMHVATEDGSAIALKIGPNTSFYYKSSNTVIGTGTTFFDGKTPGGLPNLARGFKVNATIDPLSKTTPPVALSVTIDVARYNGVISNSTTTDFDYTRTFANADGRCGNNCNDNYTGSIVYATGPTVDQEGNPDTNGFYYWDLGFPTLEDTASTAVADFVSATGGSVNFGGTVGALKPTGLSNSTWGDPAVSDSWAASWALLTPVEAPLGTVTTAFASSSTGGTFTYTVPVPTSAPSGTAAAKAVTVDLTSTSGSATLVYQVDKKNGIVTITPQDISNAGTLTTVGNALTATVPVKVFGVPQSNGSIAAYELFYYTNTASTK